MAARNENEGTSDGETYIEKYIRGVLQVENILSLERLRQVNRKKALGLLHLVFRYEPYLNLNQKRSSKEALVFETGQGMLWCLLTQECIFMGVNGYHVKRCRQVWQAYP